MVPLAALFDGGRKLFEKGKAIREAKKAEIRNKAIRKGTQEEYEQRGVTLSPEVAEEIFGTASKSES